MWFPFFYIRHIEFQLLFNISSRHGTTSTSCRRLAQSQVGKAMEDAVESARAANISEDTKHRVEEMNIADEESQAELQQLLQCLEGRGESGSEAKLEVWLEGDGEYCDISCCSYCRAHNSRTVSAKFRMPWGSQAKHRLLNAIGNCKTLLVIYLVDVPGNDVEAVLIPMHSNPVLETIILYVWGQTTYAAGRSWDSIYLALGRILQNSRSFKELSMFGGALSGTGAYHLASGLQGNFESALEFLHIAELEDASAVKHMAEIVEAAPALRDFRIYKVGAAGDESISALANALARSTSLKRLSLGEVRRGGEALFGRIFIGEDSNKSINELHLADFIEGVGDFLPLLLSSNGSLKALVGGGWDKWDLSSIQWKNLGQSLCSSSSLTLFQLGMYPPVIGDAVEELLSATNMIESSVELYLSSPLTSLDQCPWKSRFLAYSTVESLLPFNKRKLIIELHLYSGANSVPTHKVWTTLAKAVRSKVISLSSLHLQLAPYLREEGPQEENFLQALCDNSSLQEFTIERGDAKYWPHGWGQIIDCLRLNTTITNLHLIECKELNDDVFKDLMEVLTVNLTLKTIKLEDSSWDIDGKGALINEALRRNAEQDSYFSLLRRANFKFAGAKACRLFLCGSPQAGKTRLRQTLIRTIRKRSWIGDKAAQLWRTKGIEVELLIDDTDLQITVWDLAGQWIFRTLQDILFPRTNHTSIFLFMFSPYDREKSCIKQDLDQSFKSDLEEWLRFIASNSQITGRMLPKVVIVLSHMDKMKNREVNWAESIVKDLSKEYDKILDISSNNVFKVDTRRKKEVSPLKDFILENSKELLKHKSPIVPKICSQISSLLAKRAKDKFCPIWPSQKFYNFCFDSLQDDTIKSLKPETDSALEVYKAMASCLHDIGSIIIISNLDRIIVDPNWLTHVFLGELISMGHNFQVNSNAGQILEMGPLSSKTGFVSASDLDNLLSSFLENHSTYQELDKDLLEQLLIDFDLCYKLDEGQASARYYMPTIVCEDQSLTMLGNDRRTNRDREPLSWRTPIRHNQEFVGFRVQCKNLRTMSMTAAFFPRFQIYIRHKVTAEMNLTESVTCSRNFIHMCMDGHEIYVEQSEIAKSHVDIMVKCSNYKSREIAVKYVKDHIVNELITFCASPRGCPGISLVIGILQTKCVEQLIPLDCRGDNQAILIEKLKDNFGAYILKHLEEMKHDPQSEDINNVLNYEHSWPPVPGYFLHDCELAKDLLWESEVESVMQKARQKYDQQLENLDRVSTEISQEIDDGQAVFEIAVDVGTLQLAPAENLPSLLTNTSDHFCTTQPTLQRVLSRIGRLEQKVDDRSDRLEQKVDDRFDRLEATLEKEIFTIIALQNKFKSSMNIFMFKIDQIMGYGEASEHAKAPKRPYLSFEGVSIFHRVVAAIRLGTPVRLHLMCESNVGPHIVNDQPGLDICVAKENMEWLRCIYDISLKMMYYLLKAGLHITLGLGQAVPELGSLEAVLPLSIASSVMDIIRIDNSMVSIKQRSENITLEDAWNQLRSALAPKLKDNYTGLFKLYKVKYVNLEEGGYAWLCEQCKTRGVRNRSLTCL